MPPSTASGRQQAVAPHQRRLDRETASEDRPIELVEERPRIGGALRLFGPRQCLFGRRPRGRSGRFRFGVPRRLWRDGGCDEPIVDARHDLARLDVLLLLLRF